MFSMLLCGSTRTVILQRRPQCKIKRYFNVFGGFFQDELGRFFSHHLEVGGDGSDAVEDDLLQRGFLKNPTFSDETIVITNSQIQDLLNEIALNNCEKAYKKLFMEMHESLTAFAFSILKSAEDAEEVVSDFFVSIWQRRATLPTMENPRLYFFISVKNTSLNKLTSNGRKKLPNDIEWETRLGSVFFNPEELLLSAEVVKKIMAAVNELPARCKTVFKLVKEEGLKYSEVAKLLDISVKTVEAQMAIALRRIKTHSEFKNQFPELHSLLTQKK